MDNLTPKFIIKKNLQKSKQTGIYFSDVITEDILKDICIKITGSENFEYEFVDNEYEDEFLLPSYNKGRLVIFKYNFKIAYISFSEVNITSRNSSLQSVPTAFNTFFKNSFADKELYYYFIVKSGNAETPYHNFIYRLMKTIGFKFLNGTNNVKELNAFSSLEDIMSARKINASSKRNNNSTYITKSSKNNYDIFGKTYGTNKYETSIICYALSFLARKNQILTLYEVTDNGLSALPESSREVLNLLGNIRVTATNITLEKSDFAKTNTLRSPKYVFNLLERLGDKKCAFCNCAIPEIIQGAHIWPVAQIKKDSSLTDDEKFAHAISKDNGLWLCQNHHKLFDENTIQIQENREIIYSSDLLEEDLDYLNEITKVSEILDDYLNDNFVYYLRRRNSTISI